MAAQAGKDLLLKIDDGLNSYSTVAGLRSRQITLNANIVDITDQDSIGRWRELLSGAGARHASISGSGIFRDSASDATIRQIFFDSVIRNFQIIIPSFGLIQGPFLVAALVYKGDHTAAVDFDISLESAGALTFTVI